MDFQEKLNEYLSKLFAVYGIASIKDNKDYFRKEYGNTLVSYPYAISVANPLSKEILEDLSTDYRDPETAKKYLKEYYASHKRINDKIEKLSKFLIDNGYESKIIRVSGKGVKLDLKKRFAHIDSSNYAGLGWKGKNSIFINPKYGPRLTWATVLTNAPLKGNIDPMEPNCNDCHVCIDNCPINALTNLGYNKAKRDDKSCFDYINSLADSGLNAICGICIYTCPYGKDS